MTALELLKLDAEYSFGELQKSLEGVTQAQAWAHLPNNGPDYLHTGGTIYSITLHIAVNKWVYGSISFRNTEIRWRDAAEQLDKFEPSWEAALDYLHRGQEYWMQSWADLQDLEAMHPTNWKVGDQPAWKILQIMNQHDSYHAGQIAMLRYAVRESNIEPARESEDIRTYCKDSAYW